MDIKSIWNFPVSYYNKMKHQAPVELIDYLGITSVAKKN